MLKIISSKKFEKDLKLAIKRGLDISPLKEVVETLARKETLDARYKDHALSGDYSQFRECHIKSDWLLIYRIEDDELALFIFTKSC